MWEGEAGMELAVTPINADGLNAEGEGRFTTSRKVSLLALLTGQEGWGDVSGGTRRKGGDEGGGGQKAEEGGERHHSGREKDRLIMLDGESDGTGGMSLMSEWHNAQRMATQVGRFRRAIL